MKKSLSINFTTRQYMQSGDFELFYYNDVNLDHVSTHQHDYYEFYFFLEGNVTYEIADKCYVLEYGDYLLIPPGLPHRPVFGDHEALTAVSCCGSARAFTAACAPTIRI
nr:cupin domain-containing protein [Enterocloster asparagiformis]